MAGIFPGPGWYPDPAGGSWRWWTGRSWADVGPPGGAVPPAGDAGVAYRWEAQLAQLASWAPVVVVVVQWTEWPALLFHRHLPAVIARDLLGGVWGLAVAYLLVWQFRSASTARLLGYQARITPAWGAWSWIIPGVDLVVPYLAVRDLLPAVDGHRRLVARWWTWQLPELVAILGYPVLYPFFPVEATVIIGIGTLAAVPAAVLARRIVTSVTAQHGAALNMLPVAPSPMPPA